VARQKMRRSPTFRFRRIVAVQHFLADLTLPYGRVLYDYNKED
jgi:acetoacetate decarboxylase